AYVFQRGPAGWGFDRLFQPQALATVDAQFGISVAVEGDLAVVGSRFGQVGDTARTGTISVFARSDGVWGTPVHYVPSGTLEEARFGDSVAIDGSRIVVGEPFTDAAGRTQAGRVRVL